MRNQFHTILAAMMLGLGLLASAAQAGEAGKVVFVAGQASVGARPVALDAAIQEGDELTTGADGYVYVKTVDQGFLVLRPNSKARIVAYHIDAQNPANTRVKLELLQGVARSISGTGVKQARQNFRFNTPVAAIGVRGTDFVVYTDQQTSRVTVVSGGVVVSGFAGGCGPEGGGPCEGGASRELFAGQAGLMLQVQRGQTSPQLLRSPVMSPADQGAPARPDEPVGKVGATSPSGDVNLDAQKSNNVLNNSKQITPNNVTTPGGGTPLPPLVDQKPEVPVVVPPIDVTPPVVARSEPEVFWGRYQAIAGTTVDAELQAKLKSGKYEAPMFAGGYQITRPSSYTLTMPKEGNVSFALTGSDATLQRTGKEAVIASVEDARLNVNFATKTFDTGLTVVGDGLRVPINSTGVVTNKGMLTNPTLSGTFVRGYLGGVNATEAAYIFQNIQPAVTVTGGTSWSR
ncbi:FecR family protein [Rugamonas rivuli]|uniref:FecR protein domain-containing protein n=1 Tax=Rugamonas rivuli TaxID=2743358 RepID=A0A843SG76_9BURK|nr:FecR family protein [Rugamonas rivuli]MQA21203.1 hypothetical protein [Rugamonas rivuli]